MSIHLRASILFAAASFVASLPVAWFFWGLNLPGNSFGSLLWIASPLLASLCSGATAYLIMGFAPSAQFGFRRGTLAALLALVICSAIADPTLMLPALLFVAWFVVPLGGGIGWLLQRYVISAPNSSFKRDALKRTP